MIWFAEELAISDTPEDLIIELIGEYHPNKQPLITISIISESISIIPESTNNIIFSHSPAMMSHEEPEPEDVLRKYNHKIAKIKAKYQSMTYADFKIDLGML